MISLQLNKIEISNFKCFGNKPQVLDFSVYPPGLYALRGINEYEPRLSPNAAGKTTVWDALCWALYGRTSDGLRNPDILPWKGKGTPSVSVTLGKRQINRTASPNKLTIDGEHAGQDKVDSLIGMNVSIFNHTILLGQGQPLFFDLSPRDKMNLFSEVLQLDRWAIRSTKASSKVTELINDQASLRGELLGVEASLTKIHEMIDKAKKESDNWESDRQERIYNAKFGLTSLRELHDQAQKALDDADLSQEGAATEAKALRLELEKLETDLREKEIIRATLATEIEGLEREQNSLKTELESLGTADNCPTCGQDIRGTNLEEHKAKLALRIRKLNDEMDQKNYSLNVKRVGITEAKTAISKARKSFQEFDDKSEEAASKVKLCTRQVNDCYIKIKVTEELISGLEAQTNIHQKQVRDLKKRQSALLKEKEQMDRDKIILDRMIERTKFWIKGFRDIQLYVIEEALSELELVSNSMLPEVGLEDWRISYSVERETQSGTIQRAINVSILSPSNNKPVKLESWSGGEGQRLRVIGALALSDVLLNRAGVRSNIEILDEPLQYVAREGMSQLCSFLADRARQQEKQIWLIDHLAVPSAHFSGMVTVIREPSGLSKIKGD